LEQMQVHVGKEIFGIKEEGLRRHTEKCVPRDHRRAHKSRARLEKGGGRGRQE